GSGEMDWGFSKDPNPTTIPGSWCGYITNFGYNPSTDIPDYPKLGQTKDFLLIGVNHYPSFSSLHAHRTDLLWVYKYEDPALDTLDGRMTHAVSGIDPLHSNKTAVWVAHSVLGGAGAQVNWYEINPMPIKRPSLFQSGTVSDANLYVFNPGISNDRACDLVSC